MSITPEGYLPRVIDAQIDQCLRMFGAVEVAGTKWCGKTWTALAHGASVTRLDDASDRNPARADPNLALEGERPHVIDEWQRVPTVWDAVRRKTDEQRRLRGAWILTGSSTPSRERPEHSGAGRIGRLRMFPMTLLESGDSTGTVSLAALFEGKFTPATSPMDTHRLLEVTCRGGWPDAIEDDAETAQAIAREYLNLFYTESAPKEGKDPDLCERLVASIARNLGQATRYETLISDMAGETQAMGENTLASYLAMLRGQYLIDEIPGWVPPARSPKRLRVKPKRYLADPSLAASQLGMSPTSLLHDWQTFGLLFENLVMRDLEVYARSLHGVSRVPVRYYRDDAGLEVDAIIEMADGRWAAFEIKTSEDKVTDAISSLRRLRKKLCENPSSRTRQPEFMAVLCGVGRHAYEAEKNIYVIPVACLGV